MPKYFFERVISQMTINGEWFFGPNLPKSGFWGRNFENLSPDSESATPRYQVFQFAGKTDSFYLFGLNLPKNRFSVGNSEN